MFVFDAITDNAVLLVQIGNYGAIFTIEAKTMGYYLVNFFRNNLKLQEDNSTYGWVFKSGNLQSKLHIPDFLNAI